LKTKDLGFSAQIIVQSGDEAPGEPVEAAFPTGFPQVFPQRLRKDRGRPLAW